VSVESFSATHPFRPACLRGCVEERWRLVDLSVVRWDDADDDYVTDITARLVEHIDAGRCPRCDGPLLPADADDRTRPAGSRITLCRCVPVCSACGFDEAFDLRWPDVWPVDRNEQEERRRAIVAGARPAVLDVDAGVVLDDYGVTPIKRTSTGGWAEYGYDDTADRDEQEGRA
jgi:hypothetical protein